MADINKPTDPFSLEAGVPKIDGDLQPKPKYADRISKRVLAGVAIIITLVVAIFLLALDAIDDVNGNGKTEAEAMPEAKSIETSAPKDLIETLESTGSSLVASGPKDKSDPLGGTAGAVSLTLPAVAQLGTTPAVGVGTNGLDSGSMTLDTPPSTPPAQTLEQQAEAQAKQARMQRMAQARTNGLASKPFTTDSTKGGGNEAAAATQAALEALKNLSTASGAGMIPTTMAVPQQGGRGDSEQDEKRRFLQDSGKADSHYLPYTQQPSVSPNVLKRGTYLPLRLEGAINSGQPGMIRARVVEDVYDSVTGCRLLVPAMTVVQGEYDSKVAIGQTRNLVAWTYMGFEDGSDLSLGKMQGYDKSGAAGIEADVDNHYMRLFGAAFGMSMVTAGVQMSVPPTQSGTTTQTPQQSIANALTQQYGQLGAQLLGKYLQVQPTLRNYPGERFMVMLPLNIVMKKVWRDRCGGA